MSGEFICASEIVNEIAISLSGAPQPTIELLLKATLKEFYRLSGAWVTTTPPIQLVKEKADYYISPQAHDVPVHPLRVKLTRPEGKTYLYATSPEKIERFFGGLGTPAYFCGNAKDPSRLTVFPAPAEGVIGFFEVEYSATFREPWDATIPSRIYDQWGGVIIDGVIGRGMNIIDKPWTNPVQAGYHLRRFRSGAMEARDVTNRAFTMVDSPIFFPRHTR